jgi:hypothetical protein
VGINALISQRVGIAANGANFGLNGAWVVGLMLVAGSK